MTTAVSHRASVDENIGRTIFGRVVAGVDGSDPGFEACRQAAGLVEPEGWLEAVTAVYLVEAALAGWSAARVAAELEREAGETIMKAREIVGDRGEARLLNGPPFEALLRELEDGRATLAVVGTHGHSRLSEMILGGVAGRLLHEAPCSVLIARPPAAEPLFPRAILAGIDGSPAADAALAAAEYLALRFESPLRVVTAVEGKCVNLEHARSRAPELEEVAEQPVGALVDASKDADLLVVGSRGLHGWRALGSVSERVAHQAACSVLVVRSPSS